MNELKNIIIKYCDDTSKENKIELMNCLFKFMTQEYDRSNREHVATFLMAWNALKLADTI
jgi:hypothetical protein